VSYKVLDENSVIDYILSIDTAKEYFGDDELSAKEIGDGNLNYVYIVSSNDNEDKTLILKQAVPYLRIVGESYPLSRERMTYEIRSLLHFSKLSEEFVPYIYHADEDMSVIIMQYLGEHIIMRNGMIDGIIYPDFAEHIASFLANTLFKTSSLHLNGADKRELIGEFNSNSELCALTETFVFTAPYMEHETNDINPLIVDEANALQADVEFKTKMLGLKYKFMNQTDALLHGDLHTGSIMINEDETYVIDSEFAFFGPFGFDIGALLGNLVMSWVSHFERSADEEYRVWILDTIKIFLMRFEENFLKLWSEQESSSLIETGFLGSSEQDSFKKSFMLKILQDSVGFAGAKICRRQLGIAGVADIRAIENQEGRARAEKMALKIGTSFVKKHETVKNVNDVINLIKRVV